jgi:hypothetical protein
MSVVAPSATPVIGARSSVAPAGMVNGVAATLATAGSSDTSVTSSASARATGSRSTRSRIPPSGTPKTRLATSRPTVTVTEIVSRASSTLPASKAIAVIESVGVAFAAGTEKLASKGALESVETTAPFTSKRTDAMPSDALPEAASASVASSRTNEPPAGAVSPKTPVVNERWIGAVTSVPSLLRIGSASVPTTAFVITSV